MLARSVRPITFKVLGQSSVSRACFSAAATRSKKAPSKPVSKRSTSGAVYNETKFLSEDSFPPEEFLQSAKLAGALDILPNDAINLLRRYISRAKSLKKNWEQEVCIEPNTSPETLTLLAHILVRSPGQGPNNLGRHILRTASKLGDPKATITLVSSAIRHDSLHNSDMTAPLQQLERLAQGGTIAKVMVLQGHILERKKMIDSALKLYEKACTFALNDVRLFAKNAAGISEAFTAKGLILSNHKKDGKSAEEAFKTAALVFNNAAAYYSLSQFQEDGSATQEEYLMKAAASGVSNASYDLGCLYFTRSTIESENGTAEVNKKKAREWCEVAAAEGSGDSMLLLADSWRSEGRMDKAYDWLERIKEVSDAEKYMDRARELKKLWANI